MSYVVLCSLRFGSGMLDVSWPELLGFSSMDCSWLLIMASVVRVDGSRRNECHACWRLSSRQRQCRWIQAELGRLKHFKSATGLCKASRYQSMSKIDSGQEWLVFCPALPKESCRRESCIFLKFPATIRSEAAAAVALICCRELRLRLPTFVGVILMRGQSKATTTWECTWWRQSSTHFSRCCYCRCPPFPPFLPFPPFPPCHCFSFSFSWDCARQHFIEQAGALTALKKLLTHDDPAVVEQASAETRNASNFVLCFLFWWDVFCKDLKVYAWQPGAGQAILASCWPYVGPMLAYVGPMLAHVETSWELCWGRVWAIYVETILRCQFLRPGPPSWSPKPRNNRGFVTSPRWNPFPPKGPKHRKKRCFF